MPLYAGTRRALLGLPPDYSKRVLATRPIAYWPLWEPSGTVIGDISGYGRNGVTGGATPPTFGANGIGDGRTSLSYPGATAFGNVYSVSLRDAFNGAEGSALAWMRVSAAGVWTDTTVRGIVTLQAVGADNYVLIRRAAANNQLEIYRKAGGSFDSPANATGLTSTGWIPLAITWSESANQVIAYCNGVATGAPVLAHAWAGLLNGTTAAIGALTITPANVWSGSIAHVAIWTRALSPAEVAALSSPLA